MINVGLMISEKEVLRIEEWVNEVRDLGVIILIGGKCIGNIYELIVIVNVIKGMKVVDEEVFVLVVFVVIYDIIEEVIDFVNDLKYGL